MPTSHVIPPNTVFNQPVAWAPLTRNEYQAEAKDKVPPRRFRQLVSFITPRKAKATVNHASIEGILQQQIPVPPLNYFVPVGVIGGMGPFPTNDLNEKILEAGRRVMPSTNDQQHIGVISINVPHLIEDRTSYLNKEGVSREKMNKEEWSEHLLANVSDNPFWGMLAVARALETAGAHILVMPCNTAHLWHEKLQAEVQRKILHIADAALEALMTQNPSATKVALFATDGTVRNKLYEDRARALYPRITWVYPDADSQKNEVMAGIYEKGVKAGNMEQGGKLLKSAISKVIKRENPDAAFLACTEIPLVVNQDDFPQLIVIDPTTALAEMAASLSFRRAKEEREIAVQISREEGPGARRLPAWASRVLNQAPSISASTSSSTTLAM